MCPLFLITLTILWVDSHPDLHLTKYKIEALLPSHEIGLAIKQSEFGPCSRDRGRTKGVKEVVDLYYKRFQFIQAVLTMNNWFLD